MSLDELVGETVRAAVDAALRPYVRRLADPEALTYTTRDAGVVIGCHARSVQHLVDTGVLPRVPNTSRVLVPRIAVEAYVLGGDPHEAVQAALELAVRSLPLALSHSPPAA